MDADQLREFAFKICDEYHEKTRDMNLSQKEKRLIINMAHNNQIFERMLISLLEEAGYFEKK